MTVQPEYTPDEIQARRKWGLWPIIGLALAFWVVFLLSLYASGALAHIHALLRGL